MILDFLIEFLLSSLKKKGSEMRKSEDRKPKRFLTIPVDREVIDALKTVARAKGCPYTTLARMWIIERLSQEGELKGSGLGGFPPSGVGNRRSTSQ